MRRKLNIFVVSDATGATAESVITSALVQFTGVRYRVTRFPFTRTIEQVEEVIRKAPKRKCFIVYTLVNPKLRDALAAAGKTKELTVVDVMGPLIELFSSILRYSPKMEPGVFRHESDDMYKVTEAIHYTITHDDGEGLDSLDQADLIILGVSRTGKTPTSIFLSCRKLKVANIPIIKDIPLPEHVFDLPVKKVGFRMEIDRLISLRSERVGRMSRGVVPGYSTKSYIVEDVEYAEKVFRRIQSLWTIDVTNRSIEETSEWITRHVL